MTKKIYCFVFSLFLSVGFVVQAQNNLAKEFLDAHNKIRAEVGLPPLKWSNEVARYAQDWANQLQKNCSFNHRPNGKYGENLAMRWSGNIPNPADFVAQWYEEKAAFDKHFLDRNGNVTGTCCNGFMEYGHYSQIVWEKTTEVGCAVVKCGNNKYICVCNYNPAGNMRGGKPFAKVKSLVTPPKPPSINNSGSSSNSSNTSISDAEVTKMANKVCDCVNQVMSTYDPRIITYLKDFAKYGEDVAEQNMENAMMKMSETEQEKLLAEFERLDYMEDEMVNIPVCKELEQIGAKYEDNVLFEEKVIEYLKKKPNCKMVSLFIMISEQEEDDY